MDLYKALQIGDWKAAKEFLDRHSNAISAKITVTEKTALHVAAEAGHVHIVEELVKQMSEENLEIKDIDGFTALACTTYNGNYRMAECMLGKNENLISIRNYKENIPVVQALMNGHLKLARYLYLLTPLEILKPENGTMGATIVCEAIYNKALALIGPLGQLDGPIKCVEQPRAYKCLILAHFILFFDFPLLKKISRAILSLAGPSFQPQSVALVFSTLKIMSRRVGSKRDQGKAPVYTMSHGIEALETLTFSRRERSLQDPRSGASQPSKSDNNPTVFSSIRIKVKDEMK
nr:ankyrin repeat, ph and sec7 domain containing protein secg [Quercus suber]